MYTWIYLSTDVYPSIYGKKRQTHKEASIYSYILFQKQETGKIVALER